MGSKACAFRAGAVVAVFLLAGSATAQNLLANPDFSSGGSGWTEGNDDVEAVYRSDIGSTLPGGSGAGSLEVRFSFWNGSSSGAYQELPVSAGTVYVVGVSAFAPSASNPANLAPLVVSWYGPGATYISRDVLFPSSFLYDRWLRVEGSVTAPAGATAAQFLPAVNNPADPSETRPGVVVFDDALFAVAGTGATAQELFYPAAASVAGLLGTFWTTDGWFYNAAPTSVELFGAFLPSGSNNSAAVGAPVMLATLPPGASLVLTDLVADLGGAGRTGGVFLRAVAEGAGTPLPFFHATSYTATPNPNGGGSYGQGIPAAGPGERAVTVAPGLFQNAERRTNVGVLNTSADTITVSVRVLDGSGAAAAATTWTLAPYEQRQVGLPTLGVSSLSEGAVIFELTSGSGSYRGYTSSVDAVTGDAVYTEGR